VAGILESGVEVVGDLDTLRVAADFTKGDPAPTEAELVDAAIDGIAGLLVEMGEMRDRRRREEGRLRRQLKESASVMRTRSRLAAAADRTRLGSAALAKYRAVRERSRPGD
jgi:hypothetical protein